MSVQKKRISKRRTRVRRSHHALSASAPTACPKCKSPMQPHRACPSCGFYRDRDILMKGAKAEKKLKETQKEEAPQQQSGPQKKVAANPKG